MCSGTQFYEVVRIPRLWLHRLGKWWWWGLEVITIGLDIHVDEPPGRLWRKIRESGRKSDTLENSLYWKSLEAMKLALGYCKHPDSLSWRNWNFLENWYIRENYINLVHHIVPNTKLLLSLVEDMAKAHGNNLRE